MWIYHLKSSSTRSKASWHPRSSQSLNEPMDLEELMIYGCNFLAWVTKWRFFPRKSTKSPSLTRPHLLEDATPDNLPYPKELTICSYRMTWHCYIPLPTFSWPVVRYANRYSIRWRSRFLISSSVARSKEFILDLISGCCTDGILSTLSRNLERIAAILSTKSFKKCIVLICGRTC